MLTTKQVEFFQENGYLILENLIDSDIIDGWREQIWKHYNSSLDTPETWPDEYVVQNFGFSPQFGQLPAMQEIIEQLGGGQFAGGGGSPLVRWPKPDDEWKMPGSGHIDAYGPGGWSPFMMGATTYVYDVDPGGGAFVFWPQSHKTTHKYFLKYPEQVDGSFTDIEGWGWHVFSDLSPEGPKEFIASAGDVVLWHAYLCHTGSGNIRNIPRIGLFARYHHKRREEIRYEIPEESMEILVNLRRKNERSNKRTGTINQCGRPFRTFGKSAYKH